MRTTEHAETVVRTTVTGKATAETATALCDSCDGLTLDPGVLDGLVLCRECGD